jgi:hypothetical protein
VWLDGEERGAATMMANLNVREAATAARASSISAPRHLFESRASKLEGLQLSPQTINSSKHRLAAPSRDALMSHTHSSVSS